MRELKGERERDRERGWTVGREREMILEKNGEEGSVFWVYTDTFLRRHLSS